MKLQVLNGSFLAAAATIAFMFFLAAPAQAQQGQWGTDRCYYAASQGQWVRQGCLIGDYYRDETTKIWTDTRTNFQFYQDPSSGRMLIYTTAGWMDGQAYVAQVAAANQAKAQATQASSPGTGTSQKSGGTYAPIDAILNDLNNHIIGNAVAPNCTGSYNGCR